MSMSSPLGMIDNKLNFFSSISLLKTGTLLTRQILTLGQWPSASVTEAQRHTALRHLYEMLLSFTQDFDPEDLHLMLTFALHQVPNLSHVIPNHNRFPNLTKWFCFLNQT